MELFLSPNNLGGHRMYDPHDGSERIPVESVRLDDFFEGIDCPVDLIKVDIEGGEMAMLGGMSTLIQRSGRLTILSEFWPEGLQKSGVVPEDYLNKLLEYGFELYHIDEQNKSLHSTDVAGIMKLCTKSINLLASRDDSICTQV